MDYPRFTGDSASVRLVEVLCFFLCVFTYEMHFKILRERPWNLGELTDFDIISTYQVSQVLGLD